MSADFQVSGKNSRALFSLKLHRGDGMALVAMNWKSGPPPATFVGFAIEYKEPGGDRFFSVKNRLSFPGSPPPEAGGYPTSRAPIQMFRWVHFPRNANLTGEFTYRVTPVFSNAQAELSYGEPQTAALELRRETYPGQLNVTFTRGFVSSQAFVDRYESAGPIATLLPPKADHGLTFQPTHPKTKEALAWMGFEARAAILAVLDDAIADPAATVRVVAYDLNEPEVVCRLVKLGKRLRVVIDDDGDHGLPTSGEAQAEAALVKSAGRKQVKRQHLGKLQHNKTIVVDGPLGQSAVCGSTNLSWRGLYVQANNAIVVYGPAAIKPFADAFENYWNLGTVAAFGASPSAQWSSLGLPGIDAQVAFSPHAPANALLESILDDLTNSTKSSLFYSLAFLSITPAVQKAIKQVTSNSKIFVYGIADKPVGGLDLQLPDGNIAPVSAAALAGKSVPEPFKSEPAGGGGTRMHHKFLVIDFDKPSARVYMGSYNFSTAADLSNGENLLLIRDRRIAVTYMIEALRIFDHYHFRVSQAKAKKAKQRLELALPPSQPGDLPWWSKHYTDSVKIRDRKLFS